MSAKPSTNPALELAFEYVAYTGRHLFLTGKAGTGKTTFLHKVRREVAKNMIVVAPTGVAAINARARTIHSLFSLPLGFIPPGRPIRRNRKLSTAKENTLRAIDLLVIDEISMVRADLLDAMDTVLRRVRRDNRPFGGVQLLMIGDLHQLAPVVTREEVEQVSHHYQTPYYFSARVIPRADVVSIPLTRIYRQKDDSFIELLNRVRENQMTDEVIDALNTRYHPQADRYAEAGYVTLTSHNATATRINERHLARLAGAATRFTAQLTGKFPKNMYPNELELAFKVGAQVMFNRNDTAGGRYYNGKLGIITDINERSIIVQCDGDQQPIRVGTATWEHLGPPGEKDAAENRDNVLGTFTQVPLRLAWAITIHKSQGLTFEKVIIDAAASFTHGQVYVALSRCRSLEGIVLRTRIARASVRTDQVVTRHTSTAEQNCPTPADLRRDRRNFQYTCLQQLFDFQELEALANSIIRKFPAPGKRNKAEDQQEFFDLRTQLNDKLGAVAQTFQPTLVNYQRQDRTPELDPDVQTRLKQAASYFSQHLEDGPGKRLRHYQFHLSNAKTQQQINTELQALRLALHLKRCCFASLQEGFTVERYVSARREARRSFESSEPTASPGDSPQAPPPMNQAPAPCLPMPGAGALDPNPELAARLTRWRLETCTRNRIPPYCIISNAVIKSICLALPLTDVRLYQIKGVGPRTIEQHGTAILGIVKGYVQGEQLAISPQIKPDAAPALKGREAAMLTAFTGGATVAEVSKRFDTSHKALYPYVCRWIRAGYLSADSALGQPRFKQLKQFSGGSSLRDIGKLVARSEGTFTVGELKAVLTEAG